MSEWQSHLQRYTEYRKTFPRAIQSRRRSLIAKKYNDNGPSGLTAVERAELRECQRVVDEWYAGAPWTADECAMIEDMKVNGIYANGGGR